VGTLLQEDWEQLCKMQDPLDAHVIAELLLERG